MSDRPIIIDFDDGEISVRVNGKELRGWTYEGESERGRKMLAAREYVEGWCDGASSVSRPTHNSEAK